VKVWPPRSLGSTFQWLASAGVNSSVQLSRLTMPSYIRPETMAMKVVLASLPSLRIVAGYSAIGMRSMPPGTPRGSAIERMLWLVV